ncbi:MAG: ABC transporter permease [bacterium]|nr:ABC transporter permease [bacterium]
MFKTNPARTWLTILGMGVGISAVVALVGFGFGLQGILLEQIILGETLLSLNVTNPTSRATVLTPDTTQEFLRIPNVRDASPMASYPALMTFEGLTGNITVQGINPPYLRYTGTVAEHGEAFVEGEEESDQHAIILSAGALKLFEKEPQDVIGKTVRFKLFVPKPGTTDSTEVSLTRDYRVKGVTKDQFSITSLMLLSELSSQVAITEYERVQVRVASTNNLAEVQNEIINKGYIVTALSKTVEQANKIFQGVQAVLAIFGGIALVVSAIGMFNTMTVTLLERTNEIGIMRTIGASPGNIRVLFLMEAMIVGFLGGVVGIAIGAGIGMTINILVNFAAAKFGGVSIKLFRYPLLFLLFIQSFSIVVGFLTGVFPARRASKLNPLDAIRYK